jgi:hypothetical protein
VSAAPDAASQSTDPPEIDFFKHDFDDVREGYVTLSWNEVASAAGYRVVDADNHEVYSGLLPEAFISGLPNGVHRFQVSALDTAGQMIVASTQPATVRVEHWDLSYALVLFALGGTTVLAVLSVIVKGSWARGGQRG